MKLIHRNMLHLYTLAIKDKKEKLKIFYSPLHQKYKISSTKPTEGSKRPKL